MRKVGEHSFFSLAQSKGMKAARKYARPLWKKDCKVICVDCGEAGFTSEGEMKRFFFRSGCRYVMNATQESTEENHNERSY